MNNQFDTPILFLIFNRPEITKEVFNQIRLIKPKKLFIAADGPRKNNPYDADKCKETREIIQQVNWDCEIKTLFRDENLGCGVAVSSGITWFFEHVENGIILEDDCFPSLSFFKFCEELLLKFKDSNEIMLIGGNNFQNGIKRGPGSYYFSRLPHIWGWATWRRAWQYNRFNINDLGDSSQALLEGIFSEKRVINNYNRVFQRIKANKIDTWDYQWVFSIWIRNGIAITPNLNLVSNLGFRNSSTHDFLKDSFREIQIVNEMKFPLVHPPLLIDKQADIYTFDNILDINITRMIRIIKENNFLTVLIYTIKRLFK